DVGPSYYDVYPPYVTVGLGFGVGWWYGPLWAYRRPFPPVVRGYYFPPAHARWTAWRGPPAGAWRGSPPSGAWRGTPAPRSGGDGGRAGRGARVAEGDGDRPRRAVRRLRPVDAAPRRPRRRSQAVALRPVPHDGRPLLPRRDGRQDAARDRRARVALPRALERH